MEHRKTPRSTGVNVALTAWFMGCSVAAVAQAAAPTPPAAITRLTEVDVTQRGAPPSGPHPVLIEHDPGLATHTIYRPRNLANTRHPVLVWGEGGCAKNGLMFTEFLSEIASHGFVIIADGPPGGPAPAAGDPPRPRVPGGMAPDGTDLIKAVDWLEAEANRAGSRFQGKVDVEKVAAMGMSCGGLMAYGASADPRIATVGIWNSGLVTPDQKIYDGIHSPVIIVTGNDTDVAYANGKRDFETMPANVPVFYAVHAPVGHGGTYNQDNGGSFGPMAVAWLKWQLQGDKGVTGRGYFVGESCTVCSDSTWSVNARALP